MGTRKTVLWQWIGLVVAAIGLVFALTTAGAWASGMMGGSGGSSSSGGGCGCGCGGGGSSVIDPPPGAAFSDPPVMQNTSTMPGMFMCTVEVKMAKINISGTSANLMTYNGSFPGPTISINKGDMLTVHFVNSLPPSTAKNSLGITLNHTNMHTHGLHVSPMPPADNSVLDVPPGGVNDYEYDTSLVYPGALTFYHPHFHGLVAEQDWAGLAGALVVKDDSPTLAGYETHLMVLKDISLSNGAPAPHTSSDYMNGKEGNVVMVNGQVNPVLSIKPGQVQRWRFVNASVARFYKLSLQGHTMQVVGTDGGLLDKPYPVASLLMSPGERADVLVKATSTPGKYKLLSLPYSRGMMMSSPQITLTTLSVAGTAMNDALPTSVNSNAARWSVNTTGLTSRQFTLSMSGSRGYINGQDFDVKPYSITSNIDTYEVWTVINQSCMDHPWHQHVDGAQVLSITGGDADYAALMTKSPAVKDVVIVPTGGSIKLLVPVMDWGGMAMFHCHILEHEDIGMMGLWMRPGGMMQGM